MKLTTEQKMKVRATEALQELALAKLEIVLLKATIEEKDAEIALLQSAPKTANKKPAPINKP